MERTNSGISLWLPPFGLNERTASRILPSIRWRIGGKMFGSLPVSKARHCTVKIQNGWWLSQGTRISTQNVPKVEQDRWSRVEVSKIEKSRSAFHSHKYFHLTLPLRGGGNTLCKRAARKMKVHRMSFCVWLCFVSFSLPTFTTKYVHKLNCWKNKHSHSYSWHADTHTHFGPCFSTMNTLHTVLWGPHKGNRGTLHLHGAIPLLSTIRVKRGHPSITKNRNTIIRILELKSWTMWGKQNK